jgi:RNA polymerase sigma factor (sigma-70 family)
MTGVLSVPSPRRIVGRAAGDEELVERIRTGDDRAFEVLFERYQGRITAYVRGMVRDHARAEDITQEVFLNALRRLRATDSTILFRPWIYEIAKNACIDAHRRSRRVQEISYDADESMAPADSGKLVSPRAVPETVETRESLENLQGAIGALSESHADVLVLRELEGLSYREIGERLGMSRASVESTLFRARKRLEAEYTDLVSGERCRQIQASFSSLQGGRPRLRDRRQVARHLSWCQACRHQARLAGLDIEVSQRVPLRTKVGGLIPIPAFLRERFFRGAMHGQGLAGAGDSLMEWGRAAAAAAVVAVVGIGAGAVVGSDPVVDAHSYAPSTKLNSGGAAASPLDRVTQLFGVQRSAGATGVAPGAAPVGAGVLGAPLAAGPLAPAAGTQPAGLGTNGSSLGGAGQAAGSAVQATGAALGGTAASAGGAVNGLGQTVGGAVGGTTQTVGGAVRGVTQTAGGAVRGVTQTAGGTVRGTTETVGGTVRGATQTVGGTVRGVTQTAGGLVRNVTQNPANLGGAVNEAVRGTTRTAGETVRGTTQTVTGTVRGTTETVTGTVRGTTGTVNNAVSGTTGTVNQAVQGLTQTTNNAVQGVVGGLQQPAPAPAPAAPAQSTPAPAPSAGPVGQVVQNTTGALGGLLGGR